MKTSSCKLLGLILVMVLLLAACSEVSPPQATSTPIPTPTLVPPTAAPSALQILEEGWQAYQSGDLKTAKQTAEQVRDQSQVDGSESAEAWALLGLIEVEGNDTLNALFMFEKASKLGYQDQAALEYMAAFFSSTIEDLLEEVYSTYNPTKIKNNLEFAREYLARLGEIEPQHPLVSKYDAWLNPQAFDPDNYTGEGLSSEEILKLIDVLDNWVSFSVGNTYYAELNQKYPDNPVTMLLLGAQKYYNQDYLGALDLLTASVEIEPGIKQAWELMGYSFLEIGAAEHAREAFIHCLLLDIKNYPAIEVLGLLSETLRWWPEDFFKTYGFGMYNNGTAALSIVGETASEQSGIARSEDDLLFFQLTWQTETGVELTDEHLEETIISTIAADTPRLRGDFQTFDYGTVPMIYHNFTYKLATGPDWADGVIAGWYSEGITFILELRFVEDGYDHDDIDWILATYIETFTHQVDDSAGP